MKRIILIAAIAASTFACKPKHNDPVPVIQQPVADSVKFDNKKLTGDTISTYKPMNFASISVSYSAFQKQVKLSNQTINVIFKAIDTQGTFAINAIPIISKNISSNEIVNLDFYPTVSKGVQRIEISCMINGKLYKDTLSFFVKTYQPITVNFSSKYFGNQTPSSNVNFSFEVKNGLAENSSYRYKTTQVISSTGQYAGTLLLKNLNSNTYTGNGFYNIESNTFQNFSLELTNNLPGRYSLPIQIWDSDFLIETDTVVYVVI